MRTPSSPLHHESHDRVREASADCRRTAVSPGLRPGPAKDKSLEPYTLSVVGLGPQAPAGAGRSPGLAFSATCQAMAGSLAAAAHLFRRGKRAPP
jgi:hypothetical protein